MNIEHLKLFVRVAYTKNISKAGHELGLSPAVSSSYINKLEENLCAKLVHRTTRKISLTQEGQTFLPYAEEALISLESARASIGAGRLSPQGTLRVTASASFARMHIIPALNKFHEKYPDIRIDLRMSDSIINMIEGGFDVAIRNAPLNDSSLIARKLSSDQRILCASPAYLEKYGEPKSPEELINHECINLLGIESWIFQNKKDQLPIKARGSFRIDNGEAIRDLCVAGVGITICSVWCAYKKILSGELIHILKDYPLISNTDIWAVYPSVRFLAPRVRAFIDFFVDYYGKIPYWEKACESYHNN